MINFGDYGRNVSRGLPLVARNGDSYLPSFTLMITARNMQLSARSIRVNLGHSLELGDESVMTDDRLQIYPRFYKSEDGKPAFQTWSILDVLNNKIKRSSLNRKTVLIGLTATQYVNPLMTPIGEYMPPVLVAAHAVSSMLNEELFRVPASSRWLQFAAFTLIGLYLMFVLPRFRLGTGIIMSALFVVLLLNVHFYSMISRSTWLPLMAPLFALLLGHLVGFVRLVDRDRVERRNFANQAYGAAASLGQYKVDATAERLRAAHRELVVETRATDLEDLPLSDVADVDVCFGGLDSLLARRMLISDRAYPLGVPVIGYDHGGVGEILRSVCPEGAVPLRDADALKQRVAALLNGERAIVSPFEQFRLDEMLDQTLALYEELVGNSSGRRQRRAA